MTWRRGLRASLTAGVAVLAVLSLGGTSLASLFGEENLTLGQILFQSIRSYDELQQIAEAARTSVELGRDVADTYQRVNAGIDELSRYSISGFLRDFKADVTTLYPVLSTLEHGTSSLRTWDRTHTASPFTAYEAISALAGDLTEPLRADLRAGRRSIDPELVLQAEAAGGFALADVSETSTRTYDREIDRLRRTYERRATPGTASMVAAHTSLLIAEQNSHIVRLLSRSVRLDGVDKAVRAGDRLAAMRDATRRDQVTGELATQALRPPALMDFTDLGMW